MKRYASLDFLRGFAILMMLVLHMVGDYLDIDAVIANVNDIPIANILILIVMQFLGALAGLFLLVSSISNMLSMQNHLQRGKSPQTLIIRQILGGFILWIFAMWSEAMIGYHGSFGNLIRNLPTGLVWNWDTTATRWGTFEAIHTVAVCVILNGIIQGLLSLKGNWKNPKKQIIAYIVIAVVVVAVTRGVWTGIYNITGGFPWGTNPDGSEMFQPDIRTSSFFIILRGMFLGALSAPMEPIFPYLAVSCIGSIIGIVMAQPKEVLVKGFTKIVLLSGFIIFIVGLAGIIYESITVLNALGFGEFASFYQKLSYHRHWFPDANETYAPYISNYAWLWQFMGATGFSIMWTAMLIFLIDFRGKGKEFANKSKFVRRFGFVAFTNYNNQWLYFFAPMFIPYLFGLSVGDKLPWPGVFIAIIFSLLLFHAILLLWEKVNYRGSLEWIMGTIGAYLVPGRKLSKDDTRKWYQKGDLPVKKGFYDAEWLNVQEIPEDYHEKKYDSMVVKKVAFFSLIIPLFIPFNIIVLFMTRSVQKIEGKNKDNKIAFVLSLIGTILTIIFLVLILTLSFSGLGIPL